VVGLSDDRRESAEQIPIKIDGKCIGRRKFCEFFVYLSDGGEVSLL
jgi:hypothetical protein